MGKANIPDRLPGIIITLTIVAGVLIFISRLDPGAGDGGVVAVEVPALTADARRGNRLFDANCARCHGPNAAGGTGGPPLVHPIYNRRHHGDEAFQAAAKSGASQHHWKFGDMPPVPHLGREDMRVVIRYVRELQRANGI